MEVLRRAITRNDPDAVKEALKPLSNEDLVRCVFSIRSRTRGGDGQYSALGYAIRFVSDTVGELDNRLIRDLPCVAIIRLLLARNIDLTANVYEEDSVGISPLWLLFNGFSLPYACAGLFFRAGITLEQCASRGNTHIFYHDVSLGYCPVWPCAWRRYQCERAAIALLGVGLRRRGAIRQMMTFIAHALMATRSSDAWQLK